MLEYNFNAWLGKFGRPSRTSIEYAEGEYKSSSGNIAYLLLIQFGFHIGLTVPIEGTKEPEKRIHLNKSM